MGYLKGKSTLIIFERHANLKYKYGNRTFWCRGFYVSIVGNNKSALYNYVENQLKEDMMSDQITIRINKVKEMYNDTYKDAKKHVVDSDKSRSSYYEVISNQSWGKKENYDLCINDKYYDRETFGEIKKQKS